MTAWEAKHQVQLAEWNDKVAQCRSSGMTVRAWCEREGIGYKTYYRWERQILSLSRQALKKAGETELAKIDNPVFAEITPAKAPASQSGIAAVVKLNGKEIVFYSGTEPDLASAILRGIVNAE
ncbi:MAG: hypothetical protein IJ788_07325 [Oscillospiraceae bacterium]|nr:hypothetical protein [Oscillospiraceae bacterium]